MLDLSTEDDIKATSTALTGLVILLTVCLAFSRFLERTRCTWLGDAGGALVLGLLASEALKLAGLGDLYAERMIFKADIFLLVLLPAIMFDAAYGMDVKLFFRNVGSITMLAFAGTTVSTAIIGVMMWLAGRGSWCYQMPLVHNLIFGSLISATDPVTVLSVFQRVGADPDLYTNVFGESVFNDAVGMVLYSSISAFLHTPVTAAAVVTGIAVFFGVFAGSMAVGLVLGAACALALRGDFFRGAVHAETGLFFCCAYLSYLTSSAVGLSGITSVLFSGMVMGAYARPNMSGASEERVASVFKALAGLFDLFVFLYIGLTMNLQPELWSSSWSYTMVGLIALAVSRAANVVPCCAIVNLTREPGRRMSARHQGMLWWSGLRGGMAFALSMQASQELGEAGQIIKTVTFYLIFITVIVNGGATAPLLDWLDLRAPACGAPSSSMTGDPILAEADGDYDLPLLATLRSTGGSADIGNGNDTRLHKRLKDVECGSDSGLGLAAQLRADGAPSVVDSLTSAAARCLLSPVARRVGAAVCQAPHTPVRSSSPYNQQVLTASPPARMASPASRSQLQGNPGALADAGFEMGLLRPARAAAR